MSTPQQTGFTYLAFSVYDKRLKSWYPPFYARSISEATRTWEAVRFDPASLIAKFPDDYLCYHIGHFSEDSGAFVQQLAVQIGTTEAL